MVRGSEDDRHVHGRIRERRLREPPIFLLCSQSLSLTGGYYPIRIINSKSGQMGSASSLSDRYLLPH